MVNLREDGMVLDDGVVLRLAQDRFLATTSTSHAEHMLSHFEYYRDTEWCGRQVAVSDVTDAWAVIVVAGPQSRETLRQVLGAEWSLPIDGLAHLEFATGWWRAAELRVVRASFSGELAYELHCRNAIAVPLWERLVDAGLLPYGMEALDILRVEKGYLTGAEINGQTSPGDLNLQALIDQNNPCIGRELLSRPALHDPTRPCLVGVTPAEEDGKVLAGAQITHPLAPNRACGHVTSSVYSPTLSRWVGLALLDRSLAQAGSVLLARDPLRIGDTRIRFTTATHYDVTGERYKK
jgi:sarcosine oxidase subunit alpha